MTRGSPTLLSGSMPERPRRGASARAVLSQERAPPGQPALLGLSRRDHETEERSGGQHCSRQEGGGRLGNACERRGGCRMRRPRSPQRTLNDAAQAARRTGRTRSRRGNRVQQRSGRRRLTGRAATALGLQPPRAPRTTSRAADGAVSSHWPVGASSHGICRGSEGQRTSAPSSRPSSSKTRHGVACRFRKAVA